MSLATSICAGLKGRTASSGTSSSRPWRMSKTRSRRRGNSLRWSWCHGGTAPEQHEHSTANSESLQSVRGHAAMQSKDDEVTPRYFNPTWAPTLSDEARKAVNDAFDAMSAWRIET